MTEHGPLPINAECCPDCHVFPVDGYQTHLRTCPRYRSGSMFPMPEMDYELKHGMETEDEGRGEIWGEFIWSWIVWHWRQIQWDIVIITVIAIAFVVALVWLGLEGLEGTR